MRVGEKVGGKGKKQVGEKTDCTMGLIKRGNRAILIRYIGSRPMSMDIEKAEALPRVDQTVKN